MNALSTTSESNQTALVIGRYDGLGRIDITIYDMIDGRLVRQSDRQGHAMHPCRQENQYRVGIDVPSVQVAIDLILASAADYLRVGK